MLPDGTVQWAVVEFENHKDAADVDQWLVDALKYQQKLEQHSIPSMLERSKNPNGQCYHLHIAFDQPILARTVREGLRGIGKQLFGSFDNEVFPKSDDGLGNFIWLPLFGGTDDWGHGITEERTVFLDASGQVEPDQEAALKKWQFAESENFLNVIKKFAAALPTSVQPNRNGTGIELNQPGLDKMEANCPIVAQWVNDPTGWQYDHWLGLGSNYVVFKGGWDRFVELSQQDTENFNQAEIERIRDEVLGFHGPQTYDKFRDQGLDFEVPTEGPKAPAGWGSKFDPIESPVIERSGCYGTFTGKGEFRMLTPFTIEPKELLVLPDGDVLTCTVAHATGQTWNDITIENTDWHTRGKFMKALGHSECTFHGSDLDVIDVCQQVISRVEVRKQGTRTIGLHDDIWAVKNSNITAAGYLQPMELIPYDRSEDSLHSRVAYQHLDDDDYSTLAQVLFNNILDVNLPEAIMPIVGWFFAAPMKPRVMEITSSFPLLFCYGTQGGGKTSVLEAMLSMQGYQDPTVYSCTMRPFPMLTLLCSTNAVPVVLDEYKPWDMRDNQVLDLGRLMRKIYKGEVEDKGNADQTVSHYKLQAPVVVCGESKVKEAAVLERVVIAGFTDEIKRRPDMQKAFSALRALDLTGFMDRYLMFCLGEDVKQRFDDARALTVSALNGITVAPRILNNLTTITFGLELMQDFALKWGVDLSSRIDLESVIAAQVEEITGDGKGQVKLAADVMLEQLALLTEKAIVKKYYEFNFVKIRSLDPDKTYLAVHLPSAVQIFKAKAQQIGYDGELLDNAAYLKQLQNRSYVAKTNHAVKFKSMNSSCDLITKKCVIIDLEKAAESGLDLVGFDTIDKNFCDIQTEVTSEIKKLP
ncbi:MAG: hypothetical protein IPK53_12095 [bacterium]|nr:hypothetical protein [bacterium]